MNFGVWSLPAFVVAIALLIAVHEYGHYRMARACGVKVLRFSIGFGRSLWRWTQSETGTEFVLAAIPVGGYVRMLDEREGEVAANEVHQAFNRQSLSKRSLIVLAGPMANLILAIGLYTVLNWVGGEQALPILGQPVEHSVAAQVGMQAGEEVLAVRTSPNEPWENLATFDDLRWRLTKSAVDGLDIWLKTSIKRDEREHRLPLSTLQASELDDQLQSRIGLSVPFSKAVLGEIMLSGAAYRAGLLPGDEVLRVDQLVIGDAQQLRQWIRDSSIKGGSAVSRWQVLRQGELIMLDVRPDVVMQGERAVGRIGAYVGIKPATVWVRHGFAQGVKRAFTQTWAMSALSLRMLVKVVTGQAALSNISGPLTIADFAGKSASVGWSAYLSFLAVISISLGVLNLLPLPVLDGGHLMYYLWEALLGRPVSERWIERFQRGGVAVLVVMMSVALFNDVARWVG